MHGKGSDQVVLDDDNKAERISETRRQEVLLKTGALQNAILTSANFSIIATDEKGIIQLFNVGAERMLGYQAAEVVNRINPSDIHDPQEVMARAQALSLELGTTITPGFEALAFKASRGIEDVYELTYICKDGSRFPAIVSITALRDEYGDLIGYLLIGTDNSVRKQVELDLNDAIAVAEKANLAKSNFLSSMSHELRTPLSAILGFAQLMESGTPLPTPSQKRSIEQILHAGWYLLELINEDPRPRADRIRKAHAVDGAERAGRRHPRMPGHDRAAGAQAGHPADLSRAGKPVPRQRGPDEGEAGSHQPAFQRDQVQQGGRDGRRRLRRERPGAHPDPCCRHRRRTDGRPTVATLPAVQSARTGRRVPRKAPASGWSYPSG